MADDLAAKVAELKAKGNAAFKERDFDGAIAHYTEAIVKATTADAEKKSQDVATLLANRAMAQLKIGGKEALEAAYEDAKQSGKHDPGYIKAHFRAAQAAIKLGRKADARTALHMAWRCNPGDSETHKLLLEVDEGYALFFSSYETVRKKMESRREELAKMVSRGHPMTLRTAYYATWMKHWEPSDREAALCEAFMQIMEQLKENLRDEARELAIEDKKAGRVTFGEDGFGVIKNVNNLNEVIKDECFELVHLSMSDLLCENSYENPEVYCQYVESVADSREDEERFLTKERRDAIIAMRPKHLFGPQCTRPHPLQDYFCAQMGLNIRKQILVSCCMKVCLSAAGIMKVQQSATHDLRNLRREMRGLKPVEPGEESEDDEILNKNDFEEYQDRQIASARDAMNMVKGIMPDKPAGPAVPMIKNDPSSGALL